MQKIFCKSTNGWIENLDEILKNFHEFHTVEKFLALGVFLNRFKFVKFAG